MTTPRIEAARDALRVWARALEGALQTMLADVRAGRIEGDTIERDFEVLRCEMARHADLANRLRAEQGPHRGPGTPGHRDES